MQKADDKKPGKIIAVVGAAVTAAFAAVVLGFALNRPVLVLGGAATIVLGYLVLYIARHNSTLLTGLALTGCCLALFIWIRLINAPPVATGFTWHETAAAIASFFCAGCGGIWWWSFDRRKPKTKEKDADSAC